jgi:hypothetical protein
LFFYRDLRRHPIAAILQILVAVVGATLAFVTIAEPLSKWIAFGASIVAVAGGFEKLWKAFQPSVDGQRTP